MIVLVSGGTATLRRMGECEHIGHLHTPDVGNAPASYWLPWAADNAAFMGFRPERFLRMLSEVLDAPTAPVWVSCPDVVADATETLRRFLIWGPMIREVGLPAALVLQDGSESMELPWDGFDAAFIGGSTEWKLSLPAARLAHEAKARGKWVHMGRVNSLSRLRYALKMGCDSVDGTSFSRFGDTYLPRAVRVISGMRTERALF